MTRFGIYVPDEEECAKLCALLELWAATVGVHMELAFWRDREAAEVDLSAGACSLLFFGEKGMNNHQIKIAQELRRRCPRGKVVFLSSDMQFAIESYCLHPAGVLKVPMRYRQFSQVMERCFPSWREGLRWIEVPIRRASVRIPLCELEYAEASGRYCILHCSNGCTEITCSLGEIEQMLPQWPFLRCQKSYIVNLCSVERLDTGDLLMTDGCVISVGRGRNREVQDQCAEFFHLTRS